MGKYEDIINLALRRSIFFPSSEIYPNSPAGFYDFGPYGVAIRQKIIDTWRKNFVKKEDFLEIYGSQLMPEAVFKSSGHLASFNDPMTKCRKCNTMHRADRLLENALKKHIAEATPVEKLDKMLKENKIECPKCKGELSEVRLFNLMVKADVGIAGKSACYLRPETCQSIFVDWLRMTKTMRVKLPKGIAQVGRAFRNEISPRQTLLRQIEFSQMESEVFFEPEKINEIENFEEVEDYKIRILRIGKKESEEIKAIDLVKKGIVSGKLIAYFLAKTQQLYEKYGFANKDMRFREVGKDERPFYAKETWDFEVNTSVGWLELIANNYRTDYDIKGHMEGSGQDLRFVDETGRKFIPHIWEISIGLDRTFFAIIDNAFKKEKERVYLALPPAIAPIEISVFPLLSNRKELVKKAKEVYDLLKEDFDVFYDESGSIGKRYARVDEIGCPFCITIDFESLEKDDVTIRERDSTKQKRIKVMDLKETIFRLIKGKATFDEI